MDAVIMAGGRGSRLAPHTQAVPKPLLPIGGRPVIELIVRQLVRHGFTRLVIAIGQQGTTIREALGDGKRLGADIRYVEENEPLGTCGALSLMTADLPPDFLVVNGDVLSDLDLREMLAIHTQRGSDATVAVFDLNEPFPYGIVQLDFDDSVTWFAEKPPTRATISMGAYALRRDGVLGYLEPGKPLDMPTLITQMIADGRKVHGFRGGEFWIDIGTPADYARAEELLGANPVLRAPFE